MSTYFLLVDKLEFGVVKELDSIFISKSYQIYLLQIRIFKSLRLRIKTHRKRRYKHHLLSKNDIKDESEGTTKSDQNLGTTVPLVYGQIRISTLPKIKITN